jgi:hypothetical protein
VLWLFIVARFGHLTSSMPAAIWIRRLFSPVLLKFKQVRATGERVIALAAADAGRDQGWALAFVRYSKEYAISDVSGQAVVRFKPARLSLLRRSSTGRESGFVPLADVDSSLIQRRPAGSSNPRPSVECVRL